MRCRSDYLGRMETVTYPDGEEVRYEYDYGARYLDHKTSRWMCAAPAVGDYVPGICRGRAGCITT